MRISDWSSDVCSSDLRGPAGGPADRGTALCRCTGAARGACLREGGAMAVPGSRGDAEGIAQCWRRLLDGSISTTVVTALVAGAHRSEERMLGKEYVSTCKSWWRANH